MPYSYEVTVDEVLGQLFHNAFRRVLSQAGFSSMQLPGLRGVHVDEFRQGDHLLVCSITQEAEGRRRVSLHSDTVALHPLVVEALSQAATEVLRVFLQPLSRAETEELEEALQKGLRDLLQRALSSSG